MLEAREREFDGLQRLRESVGELEVGSQRLSEPIAIQTDTNTKPFLNFLLSAQDIDKEDLKLLKRKIAELRGREIE